jgi:hypothetical protein
VTDLPNCESSGCSVPYLVRNTDIPANRFFTFQAEQVADVPPDGEVMMVVLGDLREDWPTESGSMSLLRVDIDGAFRSILRDPEVALLNLDSPDDVDVLIPSPPSQTLITSLPQCDFECTAAARRFAPGDQGLTFTTVGGNSSDTYALEGGRRYVAAFTLAEGGSVVFFEDDFDHADDSVSTGRAFSLEPAGTTITIVRIFNMAVEPLASFTNIASLTITDVQDLPTTNWQFNWALDGGTPSTACFSGIDTPAGWRGLISNRTVIELTSWPPTGDGVFLACI